MVRALAGFRVLRAVVWSALMGALSGCSVKVPRAVELEVDEACRLVIEAPELPRTGAPLTAKVKVEAKAPYHLTPAHPVSVYVVGSEWVIPREVEVEAEPSEVLEDGAEIVLEAPFRIDHVGEHALYAEARVRVCTKSSCVPATARGRLRFSVTD